ncbi:MAG: CotS family spore coat protein [Vallitaleaceae bacterium]|nr:CotS family spore coat protein [Vallitaleaceae bacterium]
MFEQYENIVNQYNIQVRNFYKGRSAILVDTDGGLKLLKEVQLHEDKLTFLYELQEVLKAAGFHVDTMLQTKEGALFVCEEGKKYVLKDWTEGREIFFNDKVEVLFAVKNLANMHAASQKLPRRNMYDAFDKTETLIDVLCRHNKELIRMRNSIKRMGRWSEFELLYLECFDDYYNQAKCAIASICTLYERAMEKYSHKKVVVHGQYNHHNLIFDDKNQLHMVNFEYACYHLPIMDLYSMIRKTLEKNDWDVKFGLEAIDTYIKLFPLSQCELELMLYLLMYPEKFWKISNYYYNLNKAWKPKQTLVKLKKLVAQEERKQNFTEHFGEYIKGLKQ